MNEIFRDFEIQSDYLITARRPDLLLIKRKRRICILVDLAVTVDHRVDIRQKDKIDEYLDLVKEVKN